MRSSSLNQSSHSSIEIYINIYEIEANYRREELLGLALN